jgi:hypothetical protein
VTTAEAAERHAGTNPPPRNGAGGSGKDDPPSRITVNLTRTAAEALEATASRTGETKTDVINKALLFYSFTRGLLDAGGAVWVREHDSTEKERLRLL